MIDDDRPTIHLTARAGWINDPLSLTWHDGTYHVFFQHVPGQTSWAPSCHWGHATSADLRTWTEQPVALAPGEGDDGIWSGSLAVDGDRTTIFYTSIDAADFSIGRIRTATPIDEEWIRWCKGDIVAVPPADLDVQVYRDPFVFRDGDQWRMLVGANLHGTTAATLSYSSPDLRDWRYDGIAAQRDTAASDPIWTGKLWECPQVFTIDGVDVLITSVWSDDELHYVAYGLGAWNDGAFTVEHWGRLTWGDSYYAPSFYRDADGRPGLVFWLREIRDRDGDVWTGAMSVPHVLSLDGDVLVARPHPDVIRDGGVTAHTAFDHVELVSDGRADIINWDPEFGELEVIRDGAPVLTLERTAGKVVVSAPVSGWSATVVADDSTVQILIDGPILEMSTGAGLFAAPLRSTAATSQ
ncbi:glycoside hydrolase family 32 protein [Curtobacterium sp. MCBD17_013]|uniref:glycoside hydrolase family 32 protein n=1 Tax=Curtobacterium sp. MCBD17_013 TaxID=2175668 RepID=UPI000DAA2DDE|nr:glycoside hydrolase family 32 protein [Curtobacterium sp. MCBD17_013]PZF62764.1 glycoside hydrolase family 32 protein [Curtobacterium sp. MCBD17_013]